MHETSETVTFFSFGWMFSGIGKSFMRSSRRLVLYEFFQLIKLTYAFLINPCQINQYIWEPFKNFVQQNENLKRHLEYKERYVHDWRCAWLKLCKIFLDGPLTINNSTVLNSALSSLQVYNKDLFGAGEVSWNNNT